MSVTRSKRYKSSSEGLNRQKVYSVEDAVKVLKDRATAKFNETVDLAIKLNIDTRQSDQLVRGSLSLPNGIGKSVRVIAFAEGDEAAAAKAKGAVEVGGQDLAEKILGGWMEFDVVVAHPGMMRFVGRLGKVLGPKGLMPSPKSGTVVEKVAQTVAEFAAGKIEFRNDKEGNVHMIVGKAQFDAANLAENIHAAIHHIVTLRPIAAKGDFIKNISVSSTMGPGLKIQIPA